MLFIKKFISAVGIAAVLLILLTGCSGNGTSDIPSFSFSSKSDPVSVSEPKTSDGTSSADDTSEPFPETGETSDASKASAPSVGEPRTLVLSHDPINEKTVEIDGNKMTITGRTADSPIDSISAFPDCVSVELRLNSNGFTAVIELTDPSSDGVNLAFGYEDGNSNDIDFVINENGFAPCDLSDIVEANKSAVENALEQPLNQVAEYIAEGGNAKEVREVMDEIQRLSDEICGGLSSDYDKLRAISRWVSANIYYDYPAYDAGVPAETLSLKYLLDNHSSVCGGYSNMTSALCAAQGIKCWNVHGSVLLGGQSFASDNDGGVYHEWNFAEIDGRIIWLDAGWDSFCKLQRNGEYDNGGIGYRYFDIGEEYFADNHKANYAEYRDYFALLQ